MMRSSDGVKNEPDVPSGVGTQENIAMSEHVNQLEYAVAIKEGYNPIAPIDDIPNLKADVGLKTLIAFWLLGLCNNYGYVVMLSAAHDILSEDFLHGNNGNGMNSSAVTTASPSNPRDCNQLTTGAILLADIIPSLVIKITAPFFPLYIHLRLSLIIILSILGYILVGASVTQWMALSGVIATSIASGLGEASLLSYMAFYKDKNVISFYSSGTGGAGFFGSLSYAFFTFLGVSPSMTLYGLSSIPVIMALTFWLLLDHPITSYSPSVTGQTNEALSHTSDDMISNFDKNYHTDSVPLQATQDSFIDKLKFVPQLFKYMIPIGLVYLFEYFINQGLMELVYFENIFLTHKEQYRWYQVLYQIGVFISRSSLSVITIHKLWLLGVLQFINAFFFTVESVYLFTPSIFIIMSVVLWEGLLGGAAYVNTFHKISVEVPVDKREFSMAITSLADATGITIAGLSAFPVHNYICNLPKYDI